MTRLIAVVGMQRSGTNYLRRALCSTGLFADLDEIFQGEDRLGGFDGTYWAFKKKSIAGNPEMAVPTQQAQEMLLRTFLAGEDERVRKEMPDTQFTLFDVKFNSLHSMDSIWRTPGEAPYFLYLLKKLQIPCLYVTRENLLDIAISLEIANRTGQWVIEKGDSAKTISPFRLNPEYLVNILVGFEHAGALVNQWLSGLGIRRLEVPYEEMTDGHGGFPERIAGKLAEFLGPRKDLKPEVLTRRISSDPYRFVENFDSELVPALKKAGFSRFLASRLG